MAFTKVVGPGIHTLSNIASHNINSSGIITATKFVGPFDNAIIGGGTTISSDGINVTGIVTATGLDINGNGDISGNLVVGGNLTANGDLTTLNTTLREVELLRVDANSALAAGIITQRGAGDALAVDFDYGSDVIERAFTIHKGSTYGELVGIGTNNPGTILHIQDVYTSPYPFNSPVAGFIGALKYPNELILENAVAGVNGSWTGIMFRSGANSSGSAHGNARVSAVQTADNQADLTFSTRSGTFGERLRITGAGLVGIGTTVPTTTLDVRGNLSVSSGVVVSGGTLTIPTVAGTNTNAALNVLFQTASGVIDGGSQLTYNPGGDVLSVNGNHISANTFRGDGATGTLTCDNHSSTTFVTVSNTIDIGTVDNAADAFTLKQGSNEYITVDTTNSSELITLGNTTTNPNVSILAGNVTLSGDLLPSSVGSLDIGSASAEIGDVYLADDKRLFFGSDQDFSIKHSGTNAFIDNDTGNLNIQSDTTYISNKSGGSIFAEFTDGGASKLRYAGGVKLATSGIGITVTGEVAASQDYPVHKPSLDLNFARVKKLDTRFTFRRSGPASYVDENGYVKIVGANMPRFDHDPVTRESKGLLAEQDVANWIKYGTDLTGTGWGTNGVSHTIAANEVAPDGNTGSVSEQMENNANAYHATYINMSIPMTSGQYYTISTWLKKGPNYRTDINAGNYMLYCSRGTGSVATVSINSDFDGFVSHSNTFARSLTKYRNGWIRVTYSFQSNQNSSNTMPHWLLGNGGSYQGNGTNSVYIWGCQFESMRFPTSYIPTYGSVIYRGADVVTLDRTELTDVFNTVEGTSVVYAHMPNNSGSAGMASYAFKNSSDSNVHLGLSRDSNSDPAYHYYHDGSNSGYSRASATTNNLYKGALSFKTGDLDSYVNGSLNSNTTTFTMPTIDNLRIGGTTGPNYLGGHVARFMYYPVKLTNNQLATLTS